MIHYRYADHQNIPSFPTRRSSDLTKPPRKPASWSRSSPIARRTSTSATAAGISRTATRTRGRRACGSTPCDRRSEEHTSELQSRQYLVCRLLLEKKKESDMNRDTA